MACADWRGRASVYTGDTVMDGNTIVLQGQGTLTVTEEGPNKGNSYTGAFKNSQPHGAGAWKGASGNCYTGNWKAGAFHGQGTYTWEDGTKYVGSFFEDKFHGRAAKFEADGSLKYEGMWWNDEYISDMEPAVSAAARCLGAVVCAVYFPRAVVAGLCLRQKAVSLARSRAVHGAPAQATTATDMATVDPRGRAAVYTGDVVDGLMDGNGTLVVTQAGPNMGNSFTGQFKAGKMHGMGTWTGASGNSYEGGWVNGTFHGQGTYTWADGTKYVGEFMDDMFHGNGKKFEADGVTVRRQGLWWMDDFVDNEE